MPRKQRSVELGLVDVDVDSGQCAYQSSARIIVSDQQADRFAVADIDVVGLFDAAFDTQFVEGGDQSQGDGFVERELLAYCRNTSFGHQSESEVLAFGTSICMAPPAATSRKAGQVFNGVEIERVHNLRFVLHKVMDSIAVSKDAYSITLSFLR